MVSKALVLGSPLFTRISPEGGFTEETGRTSRMGTKHLKKNKIKIKILIRIHI